MRIDEARQDQLVAKIVYRKGAMGRRQIGEISGPGDAARAIQGDRAFPVKDMGVTRNVMRVGAKTQHRTAQNALLICRRGVHAFTRPSMRK